MNEELFVEDGEIHINFESAANAYIMPVIETDRILALKKSLWEQ